MQTYGMVVYCWLKHHELFAINDTIFYDGFWKTFECKLSPGQATAEKI